MSVGPNRYPVSQILLGGKITRRQHRMAAKPPSSLYAHGLLLSAAIPPQEPESSSVGLSVQFIEIYNDKIRDLLHPAADSSVFRVREHPQTGPYVDNLVPVQVCAHELQRHFMRYETALVQLLYGVSLELRPSCAVPLERNCVTGFWSFPPKLPASARGCTVVCDFPLS